MRVLFLDFDGVLNSVQFLQAYKRWDILDPTAVEYLNLIVQETQCEVVVSSTWRLLYKIPDLCGILREQGKYRGRLLGATPHGSGTSTRRGDEIDAWLSQHPEVTSYVILDDEISDMNTHHAPHIVKTEFSTGLQRHHYERVVQLFESIDSTR